MPDQSVAFQFWPALLTEEPDFTTLAVFADFCEDHQWPEAAAVRWLAINERWPTLWVDDLETTIAYDWWSSSAINQGDRYEVRRARVPDSLIPNGRYRWVDSPTLEDALTWFVRRYLEVYPPHLSPPLILECVE